MCRIEVLRKVEYGACICDLYENNIRIIKYFFNIFIIL
jgi:hypothetical protein